MDEQSGGLGTELDTHGDEVRCVEDDPPNIHVQETYQYNSPRINQIVAKQ